MNSVGLSGGNRRQYDSSHQRSCLPTQKNTHQQTTNKPLQFGLAFVVGQAGHAMLGRGIAGIIDDSEKLSKLGHLSENPDYRNGMTFLKQSTKTENPTEKQTYLHQAEVAFTKAANAQHYSILATACWVYAATCAKDSGKSQGAVDGLCEEAENAFENSREQILEERADLMKPYKLTNIPRLVLSSPVLAVLAPLYLFSQPNGITARTARTYLIKSGYGQDEFARVEQNEQLARRFNNSQGLLDTIASLRNRPARKFNQSQAIPPEVPLLISGSSTRKIFALQSNRQTVSTSYGSGTIVASTAIDSSIPEDIV